MHELYWRLPVSIRITIGLAWFTVKWGTIVGVATYLLQAALGPWTMPLMIAAVVIAQLVRD